MEGAVFALGSISSIRARGIWGAANTGESDGGKDSCENLLHKEEEWVRARKKPRPWAGGESGGLGWRRQARTKDTIQAQARCTLGPKMVMAVVTRLVVTRSDRLTGGNGGAKVVDVGRQVSR